MLAGVLGYEILYGDAPPADAAALAASHRAGGLSVALRDVGKSFGTRRVLDRFNLEIAAGSFVSVVGRSGEGKSTLLRLLAALETPEAGRVLLDDAPAGARAHDVTMMFQEPRLLPWQRVLGNVGIARGRNWRERALAALADVGLADRAADWPARLSGGQRQRVALARALVGHPGLLLLDEPFGALDALTRTEMHRLVLRIRREAGFTAVLVTHDVAEAVALSARVLVLRRGRIARDLTLPPSAGRSLADAAELQAEILRELG